MIKNKKDFVQGIKDGLPIGLGYLSVSFAFGMIVVNSGFPVVIGLMMSMTNLTSAGQFSGLTAISALAPILEIALTQFIINIRYSLMSLSLSQKMHESVNLKHRLLIGAGITDEVFGVASRKKDIKPAYMYGLILLPYIGWASGTLLGGVASTLMPQNIRDALGLALFGMFVAIVVPECKKSKKILLISTIAITLCTVFTFLLKNFQISTSAIAVISAVISAVIGAIMFPIKNND